MNSANTSERRVTNAERLVNAERQLTALTADNEALAARMAAIEAHLSESPADPPKPITEHQLIERMMRNGASEDDAKRDAKEIFDGLERHGIEPNRRVEQSNNLGVSR